MITNVLLDLDGTCASFFTSALHRLNKKHRDENNPITISEYLKAPTFDMAEKFGISKADFWETLESDQYFWVNMNPFPWAKQLYNFLKEFAPVTIASAPSENPRCIPDKLEWLEKHMGLTSKDCMFGERKYLMAKPDTLLIDDFPDNVEKFRAAGGKAVLVPSDWNTPNLSFDKIMVAIFKEGSLCS